jgi:hypothetical protein
MRNSVFFHIPRTAGSSLNRMLLANYGEAYYHCARDNGSHAAGVELFMAMSDEEKNRYRCISGHMPLDFLERIPWPFDLVTFLRNPMERVPSHYAFFMFNDTYPERDAWRRDGITLGQWVEGNLFPDSRNAMTWRIAGKRAPEREMLALAKENLHRFAFIGLQENYLASLVGLAHVLGLERVCHIRRNDSPFKVAWTPRQEDLDAVAKHNRLDMELYEYGKALHEAMLAEAGEPFRARYAAVLAERQADGQTA